MRTLAKRFAQWVYGDGEPTWYLHRSWTVEGKIQNCAANLYEWAVRGKRKGTR